MGGEHPPGTPVTDPYEWFEHIKQYQFEQVQTLFNAATDGEKETILEILGDPNAMASQNDFGNCICDYNEEDRAEKMGQLKQAMPQLFASETAESPSEEVAAQ